MKRGLWIALCFVLIVAVSGLLTACHVSISLPKETESVITDDGEPTDEPVPEPETEDDGETETVAAEGELMDYEVRTAKEKTYSYTDGVGNNYTIPIEYPEIVMDSADAEAVNTEIADKYDALMASIEEDIEKGVSAVTIKVEYTYWECSGVLSVCLTIKNDWGQTHYEVYSMNLHDGSRITENDTMLELLGLDKNAVLADLEDAVNDYYENSYKEPSDGQNERVVEQYRQAVEKTLSSKNLSAAVYYVDDDSLCAVTNLYTVAGAGQMEVLLDLTDLETAE